PLAPTRPRDYQSITTHEALQSLLASLQAAPALAIEIVASSADYMQAQIIGVAVCIEPGRAAYIPLGHSYPGAPQQLAREAVLESLRPILESEQPYKIGHNLKLAAHLLAGCSIALRGARFDSMLESYVWNSTATRHDLRSIARKYLGIETLNYEDIAGRGAKQIGIDQVSIDDATRYAAQCADVALQVHQTLWPKLEGAPALVQLYSQIEQPLAPVLMRMERRGVLIDGELLRQQSSELAQRMHELEAQAHALAGGPFSLDSPKQLQEVL